MLFQIFLTFFKIGSFTIGGGYVMLPLVREAVVKKRGWISEERFLELLVLAQGTPGVMAVNLSTLIGLELYGLKGAMVACGGSVFPSFLSIVVVAILFTRFFQSPMVVAFFRGALPAVVGIIAGVVWQLGRQNIRTKTSFFFALTAFALMVLFKINPILVIILGFGFVLLRIRLSQRCTF